MNKGKRQTKNGISDTWIPRLSAPRMGTYSNGTTKQGNTLPSFGRKD